MVVRILKSLVRKSRKIVEVGGPESVKCHEGQENQAMSRILVKNRFWGDHRDGQGRDHRFWYVVGWLFWFVNFSRLFLRLHQKTIFSREGRVEHRIGHIWLFSVNVGLHFDFVDLLVFLQPFVPPHLIESHPPRGVFHHQPFY